MMVTVKSWDAYLWNLRLSEGNCVWQSQSWNRRDNDSDIHNIWFKNRTADSSVLVQENNCPGIPKVILEMKLWWNVV